MKFYSFGRWKDYNIVPLTLLVHWWSLISKHTPTVKCYDTCEDLNAISQYQTRKIRQKRLHPSS